MNKLFSSKNWSGRGFSLIELLVVIGIISILSATLVPNYMSARERGRDARRKSDLKALQNALELYRQDQILPAYPTTENMPNSESCWSSGTNCTGTVYMKIVPQDPLGPSSSPQKYYYKRAADPLQYDLASCIENKADSDENIKPCPSDFTTLSGFVCPSQTNQTDPTTGKCYILNEP